MSPRNRRVPPRGNPDEQQQAAGAQTTVQTGTIPWKTLVFTTAITTVSGYVFLEIIRAVHRGIKERREEKIAAANPEQQRPPANDAPGRLDNGTFQLPLPQGAAPAQMSGPPHVGFARPTLVDVNNPVGALQHQMQQQAQATDARLRRIEDLLANSGYNQTG